MIEADAITNTTDETLTEKNTISDRIFRRAGPDLYDEILNDNRGNENFLFQFSCDTFGPNLKKK